MKKIFKLNNFTLISIGAIPAAIFRWQIDQIIVVNTLGCFLLGFINSLSISQRYKLIFGFGFCGSLTTFSGWILHLSTLISDGYYVYFLFNSIVIVLTSFLAVYIGYLFGRKIIN
tara:strand:+ start:318 stop:662 length:345 start_codon:yes stop_codon:yes gene_type:complete